MIKYSLLEYKNSSFLSFIWSVYIKNSTEDITNRSNGNMLPQPIFYFEYFRDLDTIVNIKEYKDG